MKCQLIFKGRIPPRSLPAFFDFPYSVHFSGPSCPFVLPIWFKSWRNVHHRHLEVWAPPHRLAVFGVGDEFTRVTRRVNPLSNRNFLTYSLLHDFFQRPIAFLKSYEHVVKISDGYLYFKIGVLIFVNGSSTIAPNAFTPSNGNAWFRPSKAPQKNPYTSTTGMTSVDKSSNQAGKSIPKV